MIYDLHRAVHHRDHERIEHMLAQGANINEYDRGGLSPLMVAVIDAEDGVDTLIFLLQRGADIAQSSRKGHWTALHFAAREQKYRAAEILLVSGAETNVVDAFGNTPLALCVFNRHCNIELVDLLIKHGADSRLKNHYGISALDLANEKGDDTLIGKLSCSDPER